MDGTQKATTSPMVYVAAGDTWSAEPSGRVVAVVRGASGQLALDGDGDGVADDFAGATPGALSFTIASSEAGSSEFATISGSDSGAPISRATSTSLSFDRPAIAHVTAPPTP